MSRPYARAALASLVVLATCTLVSTAMAADPATPVRAGNDLMVHGGSHAAGKAEVDTVVILGGPDRLDGKFEDAAGNPDWHGWTHHDETFDPANYWQVSDHLPLAGLYSMWCGDEFDDGPGYGNDWDSWLVFTHAVADPAGPTTVHWTGLMRTDTEPGYDYVYLEVHRAGAWETLSVHDGERPWTIDQTIAFAAGDYAGEAGDEIQLRVRFASDGAWSDEDGLWQSEGACWLDELVVAVDGEVVDSEDFDDQDPGRWRLLVAPGVGDFARIWLNLQDLDPCRDNRSAQVAFIDDGSVVPGTGGTMCQTWCYGPGGYIVNNTGGLMGPDFYLRNSVVSPVLDWPTGCDAILFEFDVYRHEPLDLTAPGMFYNWEVRSTSDPVGAPIELTPWNNRTFVYYGGPDYRRHREVVTDLMQYDRQQVQVRLLLREYGYIWGWIGTDGTPAPYFDNVAVRCWPFGGPAMVARTIDLANDGFPASGQLDLVDLGSNSVRFDMARNIAPADDLRNDPGDSLIADIDVVRIGAELVRAPRMYVRMRATPLFTPHRQLPPGFTQTGDIVAGFVTGDSVRYPDGYIVENRWSFDLPDTGFFYPGDVIHYYIEAGDVLAGEEIWATLPADTGGFASFAPMTRYDRTFTVRALPTLFDAFPGDQPQVLVWDDAGSHDVAQRWYFALSNLGLRRGVDFDLFRTQGASSGVGNGLGGRATSAQLSGYATMLYTCGALGVDLLTNGDVGGDPSDDIAVVTSWLGQGDRNLLVTGDNFVSGMLAAGASGAAFVNTYLSVALFQNDVSPLIGNQVSPTVRPITINPVLSTVDAWVPYGGCPSLATFDAVEALQSTRLAEFLAPDGSPGAYPYAAASLNVNTAENARVVYLPYDLASVHNATGWTPPGGLGIPARAWILNDILTYFGAWAPGPPIQADPPAGRLMVQCQPNPFNPTTTIALDLPRAGEVTVLLYDVRGALVRELARGPLAAGLHEVVWDGRDTHGAAVASGVYFAEVRALGEVKLTKLALVK